MYFRDDRFHYIEYSLINENRRDCVNPIVKEKLLEQYAALEYKSCVTSIKYIFKYREVNVNLYFDAYDENNLNLTLILCYEKDYYYTSLNVKNTKHSKEYLEKIPTEILLRILDENNQLDTFFNKIDKCILEENYFVINYAKDKFFVNTMEYNKNREDLPFLQGLRKVKMQDKTLCNLCETMGIEKSVLKSIQKENMTLVRTKDPYKRKKLTILLQGTSVIIE